MYDRSYRVADADSDQTKAFNRQKRRERYEEVKYNTNDRNEEDINTIQKRIKITIKNAMKKTYKTKVIAKNRLYK